MQQIKVSELVIPVKVTSQAMVCSNKIYLSTQSAFPGNEQFATFKNFILSYELSPEIQKGKMGVSSKFRQFLTLSLTEKIFIQLYKKREHDQPAISIIFKIQTFLPQKQRTVIDDVALMKLFVKDFSGFYVTTDQIFVYEFDKVLYMLTVQKVVGSEKGSSYIGPATNFSCKVGGQTPLRLLSSSNQSKNVFSEGFDMSQLGIGGLNNELLSIFRRAFAFRRLPLAISDKFGIKHVKGILLYGPPGTGKTLIARQLAKVLQAKTLQVVNGPQLLTKYVGESAQNVRKLFAPAREDEKKYGDQSPIHVIVFDEFDSISRQRGFNTGGTNAKDDVVNQLLTNLDGVESLNNIVVIGTTNRKDLIDEAVLRPGRLEMHVEIGLPDEEGRKQILKIHTQKMKQSNYIGNDVDFDVIAKITKNYTGAEIQGVVKSAFSFALSKNKTIMDFTKQMKLQKNFKISANDFKRAVNQVKPSFGADDEKFQILRRELLIDYGQRFTHIKDCLKRAVKSLKNGKKRLTSILLYGDNGTGKTSIAADFAKSSQFPYVKFISEANFLGLRSTDKGDKIRKVFEDAYRSKESFIVIDCIEMLVQFVDVGPNFSNYVLQILRTLVKKVPPNPECRLMVVGTTSKYRQMNRLDVKNAFSLRLEIPKLNKQQCQKVLGCDVGAQDVPIKKLIQFKQSAQNSSENMMNIVKSKGAVWTD